MFCPNCGKEIEDKLPVCPICGAPTGEESNVNELIEKKEKKSIAPRGMSIAGFVVSLVALVTNISIFLSLFVDLLNDTIIHYGFNKSIFVLSVVGLVFAIVGWFTGKNEAKENYKNTYAFTGIVLGILAILFGIIYCISYFIFAV